MSKSINLLYCLITASLLFTGSTEAAFIRNVSDGRFEFRLDIRHMGSYVNYAKLSLSVKDQASINKAIIFDEITITSIGQVFILDDTDANFSAAAAFLADGEADLIDASLTTPTRTSTVEGSEPEILFGDTIPPGIVDLAGSAIESIG